LGFFESVISPCQITFLPAINRDRVLQAVKISWFTAGIPVALKLVRGNRTMKPRKETTEHKTMKSPNCAAIIAIVAEMARCLNKNIAKVHVAPLDSKLAGDGAVDLAKLIAINSQS
jgi:hypothetical protein